MIRCLGCLPLGSPSIFSTDDAGMRFYTSPSTPPSAPSMPSSVVATWVGVPPPNAPTPDRFGLGPVTGDGAGGSMTPTVTAPVSTAPWYATPLGIAGIVVAGVAAFVMFKRK